MHKSIDLDSLEAFIQTARLGGLSAAARAIGRDASVITRRVAELEQNLGVRLLARTTRRVTLTEVGARYLDQVQAALELLATAHDEAVATSLNVAGTLRVALPLAFGRIHITPDLAGFQRAHPGLRVDTRLADRYVDLVEEGIDVAVRLGTLNDSTLVARRVASYDHRVYAAPGYLRRHGSPRSPEELSKHPAIGFGGFRHPESWVLRRGSEETTVTVPIVLTADDGESLIQAAEAECGLLLVADWLAAPSLAAGRLATVLPAWSSGASRNVYVVTPARKALPAKTKAFIDWVVPQVQFALKKAVPPR